MIGCRFQASAIYSVRDHKSRHHVVLFTAGEPSGGLRAKVTQAASA